MAEYLTADEHQWMRDSVCLWNDLCRLVGRGRSREGDLSEAGAAIHVLQNMVLANAAARAYPERYRLLGGEIDRSLTSK